MKKFLIVVLASIFLSACGAGGLLPGGSASKPKVGDTVVAKWAQGSFYEGKVEKVDGEKYTIAWSDKSNSTAVDSVNVFTLPVAGAKPDVKAGEMVLAKTTGGNYWLGGEVTSVEGSVYKVKLVTGTTSVNLAGEAIIKVPAAIAADFKDTAGSTDFLIEAKKGKPTVPADYKPKKGDRILGEWSINSWYSGRIDNISGSNIYVAWDDNTKPSAVNMSKVLPMPTTSDKATPTEKQFVLVKPDSGSNWQYGQAANINGNKFEVKLANNQTKTVTFGEFVLLN